eukprot:8032197-Alexandrium_andersonii.AAC.1
MPSALALSPALAGLTPSRFWSPRSQRAAPSMQPRRGQRGRGRRRRRCGPSRPWPPLGPRPAAAAQ